MNERVVSSIQPENRHHNASLENLKLLQSCGLPTREATYRLRIPSAELATPTSVVLIMQNQRKVMVTHSLLAFKNVFHEQFDLVQEYKNGEYLHTLSGLVLPHALRDIFSFSSLIIRVIFQDLIRNSLFRDYTFPDARWPE